jgi:HEAT repeat protein
LDRSDHPIPPDARSAGLLLVSVLTIVAIIICVVSYATTPGSTFYSHFFYIPVLAAAFLFGRKAVGVAVLLAGVHLAVTYSAGNPLFPDAIARALILVLVALIAGSIVRYWSRLSGNASAGERNTPSRGFFPGNSALKVRLLKPGMLARYRGDTGLLIEALDHPDPVVVYEAAELLGKTSDERAVEPLIRVLAGKGTGGVRWKASEALARIGPRAVGPLSDLLGGHEDPDVRWKAAFALGEIGDEKAVGALISALSDVDRFVRTRAAHALSRMGNSIFPALEGALNHPDSKARQGAAEALGRLGNPRAAVPLLLAMGDPSEEVRTSAAYAFGTLPEPLSGVVASLSLGKNQEESVKVLHALQEPYAAESVLLALERLDELKSNSFNEVLVRAGHPGIQELQTVAAGVCILPVRRNKNEKSL